MSASTRRKGVAFEREIALLFIRAGFTVRGLEGGGDHFVVSKGGETLHLECKRHERPQIAWWLKQQERDAPAGLRRALVWRQSRKPAYVIEPLDQFIAREAQLAELQR